MRQGSFPRTLATSAARLYLSLIRRPGAPAHSLSNSPALMMIGSILQVHSAYAVMRPAGFLPKLYRHHATMTSYFEGSLYTLLEVRESRAATVQGLKQSGAHPSFLKVSSV